MTELSNSLADLAERVKAANEESAAAEQTFIDKALQAGRLLCDAKDACAHGEWTPFLSRAQMHERQARRLMQIARSGLKSDAVSEIGGIKATLEWLARRVLPEPDEVVFISRAGDGPATPEACVACILPSEHAGFYDVTAIGPEGCFFTTQKPVLGESKRLDDGTYFNGLWGTVEHVFPLPLAEWDFGVAPIYLLLDDCAFLADLVEAPPAGDAPLPLSYIAATEALEACAEDFTAEKYFKARRMQKLCLHQMEKWPNDPRMISTYARMANDRRMGQIAARVDAMARKQHLTGAA
ncbi:DUF3102 domain-containing protein [Mesorhizobium sp. M2D.F.Ca.ET.223.01.1.1]|uniref:DUF3102 domain-containing protein n=1 Tax=Mesorhizobium sp. M2D.F.Ca.ET.223.01.1.1 TaxID=2563940 RepID=UPI0010926F24|nr:DUF3102 domain-containing protein [Mesorhizobium sp. M2D.F.Ca.ET.223.01.1.1]TGR84261.1 DUF3102 domain-containing protein [Mesorhizobium sp. M2D.F.Ca.ET.223.01.1.1]TGT75189.1 DUF3102 domain-containing protein [bacterium M00.F.Ca.ET.159.01.1.1]TGT88056.1 DUF3102 domain-containing protein [bacterium M00.F.Ca.ET.157.01.1.1]